MNASLIKEIEEKMQGIIDSEQMRQLHQVLESCLSSGLPEEEKADLVRLFLAAKRVEGCSEKTVKYYDSTIRNAVKKIGKDIVQITTDDLRIYLDEYQTKSKISKVTVDNIRRILSSFFSWLEDEDYVVKSPVRRIHKVKTCKTVKETYSDEDLELMRDECEGIRDLAIIDLLASTGMRVGDDDDKIRLNQRKPSKYKGLSRFGPEKNLQRINKFMKERPIFYKNLIQMKENFRFYLRCFYCITKVVILQFNSENRTELARNG